ncbi:MAG TPA: N-acetylmuramoyl-L-alanine amidase [Kineosporiaceae bacterium]|nr:N-acetylmuramoyl-L-alanine amidase [Kineosporiaceae bacterium]
MSRPHGLRPGAPAAAFRHRRGQALGALLAALLTGAVTGCSGGSTAATGAATTTSPATSTTTSPLVTPSPTASTPAPAGPAPTSPTASAGPSAAPSVTAAADLTALRGKVIVIDPGHNGGNGAHPDQINRLVAVGNGTKACDTAGTQTNAGYAEHTFTWDLAQRLAATLRTAGAQVVLTRSGDAGVGPCINERAAIGNQAHADLAISLHADGASSSGYGFHIIEPGSIGSNTAIVAPSRQLGGALRDAFRAGTGEPYANYIARSGIDVRTDLGGLNLSAVPKVFIECGNMRNAADASRLTSPAWRQRAAQALAAGMAGYLSGH